MDIFNYKSNDNDNWEEVYFEIKDNWPRPGMDLSLDRIKNYLDFKGNPQDDLKVIHIGGTNGKGSTGTFIKSILEEEKLKVGFFSSPSIISDNETIKIGEDYISYETYAKKLMEILKTWKEHFNMDNFISFFEAETLVAIDYFKEEKVDLAIFEVGLGGRLDSTNVFSKKLVNVITHIGLDHLGVLGSNIKEIAGEKAGIIQQNDRVLAYPIPKDALEVLTKKTIEMNGHISSPNFKDIKSAKIGPKGSTYSYKEFDDISINMVGENQIYNSIMAIETIKILNKEFGYSIMDVSVKNGLKKAFIPGRLEWINYKGKDILLDGAHNEDGVNGFVDFVSKNIHKHFNLVVGVLKDKEYEKIYSKLSKLDCDFYLTEVPFPGRKLDVKDAAKTLRKFRTDKIFEFEDPIDAIKNAIHDSDVNNPVIVTGSLYLISKIRKFLVEDESSSDY